MASTNYNFTISTAFPNAKVDSDKLATQLRSSAIITALDYVATADGVCSVWFKDALSSGDQTLLGAVVAAHDGVSGEPDPIPVVGYSGANPAPIAADGKPFVLPNSFPGEVLLNFAGVSDKLSPAERFGGDLFGLTQAGQGTQTFTIDLLDGIFLAGGHIDWDGGSYGSSIYMELTAPASTTKAPATANQGNCNLVPIGGGLHIIVPAAGNGAYDLDVAIPIPATNDETNEQTGYWTYSEPWVGKGSTTPGVPQHSKYNLYDFPLELAHFTKLHLMLDTGQRDMVAPAIKPKWILPEWKMKVAVTNADANKTLRVVWDLLIARRKSA